MRLQYLSLFLAGFLALSGVHAAECAYDHTKMLAMEFYAFDQDMTGGWRSLDWSCQPQILDLLHDYREAHKQDLPKSRYNLLAWHEGQVRANMGDYVTAVPLLSGWLEDPMAVIRDYAQATIAFLNRDKPALLAARAKLAAEPMPEGFDPSSLGNFKWPLNLNIVDGLAGCFDKPYEEAYGSEACTQIGEKERLAQAK